MTRRRLKAERYERKEGIYRKYQVKRLDGGSGRGQKHEKCEHFVLDLMHDPHAVEALIAYAKSCRGEHPALASDVMHKVDLMKRWAATQETPPRVLREEGPSWDGENVRL